MDIGETTSGSILEVLNQKLITHLSRSGSGSLQTIIAHVMHPFVSISKEHGWELFLSSIENNQMQSADTFIAR
jgi:hypothetical protein